MFAATCEGCGKAWTVQRGDRAYRCKDCGGRVVGEAQGPPPIPAGAEEKDPSRPVSPARQVSRIHKAQLIVFGVGAAAVAGVIFVLLLLGRPPTIEDGVARFREAWGSGDYDTIRTYFTRDVLNTRQRRLLRDGTRMMTIFQERGWLERLPPLGEPEIRAGGERYAEVHLPLAGGTFVTRWQLREDSWRISEFQYPRYTEEGDPPSAGERRALDEAVAKFASAWEKGRDEDIKPAFIERNRERWSKWLDGRGARLERKALSAPEFVFQTRINARVTLVSGSGGTFTTRWKLIGGRWMISGLKPDS